MEFLASNRVGNGGAGRETGPGRQKEGGEMKIVVDAMGGDHAPGVVVAGAVAEARERGTPIILVGIERSEERRVGKECRSRW